MEHQSYPSAASSLSWFLNVADRKNFSNTTSISVQYPAANFPSAASKF
jgi:hypothetical protein